ncbi:hypothetical protein ACRVZA_10735 [Bacillus velezensis]|nr:MULTISPECIES: hypothetical protein [Bacillus]ARZ59479.1 transposase [Bacillus velezensis]MCF6447368.1 hypothetical protein [Bacillus sp. MMG021]MCP8611062.1 hypothetical protein [Bacillus velezensis]MCQ9137220.1 hypothetical protein [Bacillus amyloliquefaciens]MCS3381377.1 hypothetical protein [Bacillus velezensis]
MQKATLYNTKGFRSKTLKLRKQQSQVPIPQQVKREMGEKIQKSNDETL